jgi:hypothetical protein
MEFLHEEEPEPFGPKAYLPEQEVKKISVQY